MHSSVRLADCQWTHLLPTPEGEAVGDGSVLPTPMGDHPAPEAHLLRRPLQGSEGIVVH